MGTYQSIISHTVGCSWQGVIQEGGLLIKGTKGVVTVIPLFIKLYIRLIKYITYNKYIHHTLFLHRFTIPI